MPFAEFQAGNAGLALPTFGIQSAEAASSLMERAQRRRLAEQDFMMRQEKHAADIATSDLNQQALRAEIGIREIQFREDERVAKELADIRAEYNRVAPDIDAALASVQNMTDPFQQRRLIAQLESQAARFNKDPKVAAILQRQMQSTLALVDANEKSKLQEYISTAQYATTEADARMKFPGQALRLVTRPNPIGGAPMSFFLPTGQADPQVEARAMAKLNAARVTGDVTKIEAVQQDADVQTVMAVPNSNFSGEYYKAVQAAAEFTRKREKDKRDLEDQRMQEQKFRDDQNALTVPGFSGKARSGVVAAKIGEESAATETSMGLIYELEDITNQIAADPKKIADPELSGRAGVLAKLIQATNRLAIVGPGAVTEAEWKILEKFAQDPTDASVLVPFFRSRAKAGYRASREALFNKMATTARQNGLDVDARYWSRDSIRSRRISPDGPSTPTNSLSYKGKSYTKLGTTPDGMVLVRDETGKTFKIPDESSRQSQPAQGNARP
jgi:hypothetical protein